MEMDDRSMSNADATDFYASIPVFRSFARLMDPALYRPLPDDWTVGVADVVESTKAIAERRYKAVNMAGAAVIAAVTNALEGTEFPFVFGGDGASFAVGPDDFATKFGVEIPEYFAESAVVSNDANSHWLNVRFVLKK